VGFCEKLLDVYPTDNATTKELFDWKDVAMTESQNRFKARHKWFGFRKYDLYDNLSDTCNIPRLFNRQALRSNMQHAEIEKIISELIASGETSVVAKEIYGHSSKEVKVLDLTLWPDTVFDHIAKQSLSVKSVLDWMVEKKCVLEQSLSCADEVIPFDFKVYCVDGIGIAVSVIDRMAIKPIIGLFDISSQRLIPWEMVFLGGRPQQWSEMKSVDTSLVDRIHAAKDEAERVCASGELDVSNLLVGLDMYVPISNTPTKVFLGEITPRMGIFHANYLTKSFMDFLFRGVPLQYP
jgi:hypothetical protein